MMRQIKTVINISNSLQRHILMLLVLLTPALVLAEKPLALDHFAFSSTLSEADNSLREVTLPINILEKIQRKDFGDLRIFNAQGQEVLHQFRPASTRKQVIQTALNFYPFDREQVADPAYIRIKIQQSRNIRVINLESDQQKSPSSNEYQYIAENRNTSLPLCELILNWDQPKPNMILSIRVDASKDLQNWSTLNRSANLSKLDYAGSKLIHARLAIACTQHTYLRLSWVKPEPGLKLKYITAIYKQKKERVLQQKIIGKPDYGDDGNWYFKTATVAPVTQLELIPPTDGLLYKGRLYSRPDDTSQWRHQSLISQYQLKISGTKLSSTPLMLRPNNDSFWKIELDSSKQLRDDQLPDIKFGWRQRKLVFLAQGEPPFTLAYGNSQIAASNHHGINDLIKGMTNKSDMLDEVTPGKPIKNTNITKLNPEPKKTIPWGLIGLWLLLILGTAVLGYMAYRLYQQMNE
ncbi:MAG: DUF3999 domain-containing protein [Xanthomonadales bacterium]|nr:DUF3999 domain-containing protein [Xanthomonadales bacterium]